MEVEFLRLLQENTDRLKSQRIEMHYYPNKDEYLGFMEKGKRHGLGKLTYLGRDPSGKTFFTGEWVQDKRHGQGALVESGQILSGRWEKDIFTGS